jgi:hypothetical protein
MKIKPNFEMKTTTLAAGLVVILGCLVAGVMSIKGPQPAQKARHETQASKQAPVEPQAAAPVREAPPEADAVPPSDHAASGEPAKTEGETSVKKQEVATPARPVKQPKQLQDPLARVAMSLVGADPDAEAYWLEAIYDSSLPDQEREDLIEDLNEEGLSDHQRPGPEDFPLIMNRIVILQEIFPHADQFMLPHLREAYKDLLNLAEITQGGGKPVK